MRDIVALVPQPRRIDPTKEGEVSSQGRGEASSPRGVAKEGVAVCRPPEQGGVGEKRGVEEGVGEAGCERDESERVEGGG